VTRESGTDSPGPSALEDSGVGQPRRGTVTRFFLLPLLVVAAAVGIFLLFNLMTFERRSPADYLGEVRGGSANRRWQAAFELSRSIGRVPPGPERRALAAETLRIFEGLSSKRREDVAVRRYLVLVLGKLQQPEALPALLSAAKDPDPETRLYAIWSLGMIGDAKALNPVLQSSASEDAGARKMAAYVLGRLADPRAVPRLRVLLEDPVADVRWNAAIALASLGDRAGVETLRSLLDRSSLARQASLTADQAEAAMVGAAKGLALLRDRDSLPLLERVAKSDPNLRVRASARDAIDAIRGPAVAPATPSANVERSERVLVV
jgi:HEAT repeat protein